MKAGDFSSEMLNKAMAAHQHKRMDLYARGATDSCSTEEACWAAALAAVAPLIARTALERAALLVENRGCRSDDCCDDIPRLAAAIRALPDE